MDIEKHWDTICRIVDESLESTHFCAIATSNPDGSPRVSPIGSLILKETGKGFFFEDFAKNMRQNLDEDQRICILAVRAERWHWLKAILSGRFDTPPGVRLMGRAGARRKATPEEVKRFQERVRLFRKSKGYELLWKNMRYGRDVTFDTFEPVDLGVMTRDLWEKGEE